MGNKERPKDSKQFQSKSVKKQKEQEMAMANGDLDDEDQAHGAAGTSDMMQISENDILDDDLCDTCRNREVAFLKAKVNQDEIRVREKIEEDAVRHYINEKERTALDRDKALAERSRRLNVEIAAYNRHLIDEKRKANEEKIAEPDGYLFRNRPDTAVSKQIKQQQMLNDLQRQMIEKKEMELKNKSYDQFENVKHFQIAQDDLEYQRQKEKLQEYRKKFEYRQALEEQIAAKSRLGEFRGEPWWSKPGLQVQEKFETEHEFDQTDRLALQRTALDNLEQYLAKQSVPNQQQMTSLTNFSEKNPSVRRINPTTQALVEDSWKKVAEDKERRIDLCTVQYTGGTLMDQLQQYPRCKKCQKSLQ